MTRKSLFLLSGSVLIGFASQGPAYGFDYKIHPGSMCQPARGNEVVSFMRGPGYIYHTNAGQALQVTCPILRDRVPHWGRPDERTRLDVGVHFDVGAALRPNVQCQFVSLREDGSTLSTLSTQDIVPNPNQAIQSRFWDVKPEDTAIDGTYSIICTLPAYAFLLRYVVGEDKSTDEGGF
jgi:hypothetical protein